MNASLGFQTNMTLAQSATSPVCFFVGLLVFVCPRYHQSTRSTLAAAVTSDANIQHKPLDGND